MHVLGPHQVLILLILAVLLFRPRRRPPAHPLPVDDSALLRRIRLLRKGDRFNALNGEATPEAKLLLKAAWKEPIASGTEVTFDGVPQSFTSQPFVLIFNVEEFDVVESKASRK